MSMTVSQAWRVPKSRYLEVLAEYRKIMKPLVSDRVFKLLRETPDRIDDKPISPMTRMDHLWRRIDSMARSPYRDLDDPASSVSLYPYGKFMYIRCFGEYRYHKLFADLEIKGYEEYNYTDATDCQVKTLGARGWRRRRDVWNAILDHDPLTLRVYFFEPDQSYFDQHFSWGWFTGTLENPDFYSVPEQYRGWFLEQTRIFLERRDRDVQPAP